MQGLVRTDQTVHDEQDLLTNYRRLSPNKRAAVLDILTPELRKKPPRRAPPRALVFRTVLNISRNLGGGPFRYKADRDRSAP